MMKKFYLLISVVFICACGNKYAEQEAKWKHELDSLNTVAEQQHEILEGMTSTIAEVSTGLDSITRAERIIISGVDETGAPMTRNGMKVRLAALAELIKQQKAHMSSLEQNVSKNRAEIAKLKSIIAFLNASLEEKNAEIERLQAELDSKNYDIRRLSTRVASMSDTISNVRQENNEQRQLINEQAASLNVAYYMVATKKKLIEMGLVSKSGVFGKTKVSYSSLDKSVLNKVDIRSFKTLQIDGKSPKILSDVPKDSYSLNGSGLLTITTVERFWSGNNKILIIQVK